MELPQVVNQIVTYVPKINYDQTDTPVSLFETTIRYLGGMLAGKWACHVVHYHSAKVFVSKAMTFLQDHSKSLLSAKRRQVLY